MEVLKENAWAILIALISVIVGWTLLGARVAALEQESEKKQSDIETLETQNQDVLRRLSVMNTKLDLLLEQHGINPDVGD